MDLWQRLVNWFNTWETSTDTQNIRDSIQNAEQAMRIAETVSEFRRVNRNSSQSFRQARQALGSINSHLDALENLCLDIQAIRKIRHATSVLNQRGGIARDPQAATRAFGELFQGFGQLAGHLHPPANMYNPILQRLGDGFFANVAAGLDPAQRPRNRRQFRQIEESQCPNIRGL